MADTAPTPDPATVEAVADSIALVLSRAVPDWNDAQVAQDCARAAIAAYEKVKQG